MDPNHPERQYRPWGQREVTIVRDLHALGHSDRYISEALVEYSCHKSRRQVSKLRERLGLVIHYAPIRQIWWTPENEAKLLELWRAGWTGGEIAAEMHITRSTAIGKLHRMGHGRNDQGIPPEEMKQRRYARQQTYKKKYIAKPKPPKPAIQYATKDERGQHDLPIERTATQALLWEMTRAQCRWPISRSGIEMLCCGARTHADAPYCFQHCCRAYIRR